MPSSESWRLFVAISVPETIKAELQRVQTEFQKQLGNARIRWTRPGQFHLTLRFLGNVQTERVDDLKQAITRACEGFGPLELRAERIGFFPAPRFPRVIWASIRDTSNQILALQKNIERVTSDFSSEPAEKEFAGHITLGRCHGLKRPHVDALLKLANGMADCVFGEWTATQVELIRSELTLEGSCYTSQFFAALQK